MSATEQEQGQQVESRSSVSISMDSKGLAKVSVKVYVGEDDTALAAAHRQAVDTYRTTKQAVVA